METVKTKDDTSLPRHLFHQGTNFRAWEFLGVHRTEEGYIFRVWAPGADCVFLCADFTSWDKGYPMEKESREGLWVCRLSGKGSLEGMPYKYRIIGRGGDHLKSDPYAILFEMPPKSASVVCTDTSYNWHDEGYLRRRRAAADKSRPMNIYEVHALSWKKRYEEGGDPRGYLDWRTFGDDLAEYVTDMGFTHVELLPVMEHPFDPSWGYQVSGYFAPTARMGSPADFKYFIDRLHSAGIGVILDFVPAHFPRDRHGLFEFDGGPLYEYQGADRMEHRGWGTRFFDVGREEVQSFLISAALFWLEEYHADGLRVDAVASMLYLDYDRAPGEWIPNIHGGRENLEAVAFLRKMNTEILSRFPDAVIVAEESSEWEGITSPVEKGGLGFTHKWNMGFANDMFDYLSCDPVYRHSIHERLTFPMMYAFNDSFILPVSHDEVVHGKCSLIGKMFGDYDDKFSLMRTYLSFMYTMPGKKLMFMGTEFAQFREWDCESSLEWFMIDFPRHHEMREFVRTLCRLYKSAPPLWDIDDSWEGFEWIDTERRDENIVSFIRRDRRGRRIYCIFHFAPNTVEYTFPTKTAGNFEALLSTDDTGFGGAGKIPHSFKSIRSQEGGNLTLTLPGNCAVLLRKEPSKRQKGKTAVAEVILDV